MTVGNGHGGGRAARTDLEALTAQGPLAEHDLAAADIAKLVTALLVSIERGELNASPREIAFLSSIGELLTSPSA